MMKAMKKMVLTGAAVTVMMSFAAAPAMADNPPTKAPQDNPPAKASQDNPPAKAPQANPPTKAPQANPPVKDPGIGTCDITPTGCVKDPATNDPSPVGDPMTGNTPMAEDASAPGAMKAEEQEEQEVPEGITTTAPEKADDTSAPKVISADDGAGQTADSPTVHGCPNANDGYDEELDLCLPNLEAAEILFGDEPWPDTAGGYVSLLGGYNNDTLDSFGVLAQLGGMALGDALVEFGKDGGPIGWGIQGLGHTVGFVGEVGGGLVLGVNTVTEAVHEGLGAAVDAIGDAAEDAWDTVSGWF